MRRGTRVGEAYVALTADGSNLNEDIVDAVDDAGDDIEKSGDEHGERYGSKFSEGFRAKMDSLRGKIADRLNRNFGDAGEESGKTFSRKFGDGLDGDMLERIGDRLGAHIGGHMVDALNFAMSSKGFEGNKIRQRFGKKGADLGAVMGDQIAEVVGDRLEDVLAQASVSLEQMLDERGGVSGNRGVSRRPGNQGFDVGRLFGKGSRNNFLNLFGRSVGGITRLIQKATSAATSMFSTFQKGFSQAAEGASFFQKILAGGGAVGTRIGAAFSSMAAAGPAAVGAILAVVAALSIMVSIAGALVGILTALVATITAGLVGALAVAGGAMLAVVAAGGLLTSAFMSMTNAQKDMLTSAFKPLKAEMVGIAQLMLQDMVPAFATWSKNLQEALRLLAPVAQVMGSAFAQAGNIFTDALSGPGFQRLSQALTQELPAITVALSSALGGFLNGLMGTFAAIMPLVTRFAQYLADVAARFSTWANSASGQNAIVSFVDRAVESLLSLWNFVREFSGFIFDVLFSPAAMNAGNSIFDSLSRAFAGFRRNLTNGKLEKWFNDAKRFAKDFGVALSGVFDVFGALYNSGVLQGVGTVLRNIGKAMKVASVPLGWLVDLMGLAAPAFAKLIFPIELITDGFGWLVDAVRRALGWLRQIGAFSMNIPFIGPLNDLIRTLGRVAGAAVDAQRAVARLAGMRSGMSVSAGSFGGGLSLGPRTTITAAPGGIYDDTPSISSLISSGTSALNNTYESSGGYMPDPSSGGGGGGQWKNPYRAYAESLIKDGPSVVQQIKQAIRKVNRDIRRGLAEVSKAEDRGMARDALNEMIRSAREAGKATVEAAQDAINSAAQNLSSASSPREAQRAFREIRRAQRDMGKALRAQRRIDRAADILGKQRTVRGWNVRRLERGVIRGNTTMEEFAVARSRIAAKLERANQKLTDAIAMRDNYESAVSSSVRTFGSLMTAQAQTINGVQQALTAGDITDNLTERLEKIRKFQNDLRLLIAQGLSNEAYQQLVDAGVEQGGQFAEALLSGGLSSISEVNGLVSQINGAADQLGADASSRLYQAGVDAAQGLVDGLESLSDRLDAAAARLGDRIAQSIANALGIRSPSRRLMAMMDEVGDGAVIGLDRQHVKVGAAGSRLADQIAVSPEVAAYASRRGTTPTEEPSGVSGNGTGDPRFRDLIVNTPTEDPEAVAMEVLNEVTGRI